MTRDHNPCKSINTRQYFTQTFFVFISGSLDFKVDNSSKDIRIVEVGNFGVMLEK